MNLTFIVHVTVEPATIALSQDGTDDRSPLEVVSDEIESNLASVPYVKYVSIKGASHDREIHAERQRQPRRQAR